jgi:hypothetical protein
MVAGFVLGNVIKQEHKWWQAFALGNGLKD